MSRVGLREGILRLPVPLPGRQGRRPLGQLGPPAGLGVATRRRTKVSGNSWMPAYLCAPALQPLKQSGLRSPSLIPSFRLLAWGQNDPDPKAVLSSPRSDKERAPGSRSGFLSMPVLDAAVKRQTPFSLFAARISFAALVLSYSLLAIARARARDRADAANAWVKSSSRRSGLTRGMWVSLRLHRQRRNHELELRPLRLVDGDSVGERDLVQLIAHKCARSLGRNRQNLLLDAA